jgi:hypothetical protein
MAAQPDMYGQKAALTSLPAPSTFAASRDDVLASLSFFFGDPASPEKLKDVRCYLCHPPRPTRPKLLHPLTSTTSTTR